MFEFQDAHGSFSLIDTFNVDGDIRVDFCFEPTYILTALLIKAYLRVPELFSENNKSALALAMDFCCKRNMEGHGYDSLEGLIRATEYFVACDVKSMVSLYPRMSEEFTSLINDVSVHFSDRVKDSAFYGYWGENYEEKIRKINNYFSNTNVFTYGTLMQGQYNHFYVENSVFLGNGEISGFEMYNLGSFPGVIAGKGRVIGELYNVSSNDLEFINRLEGEGTLYTKTPVKVKMQDGADVYAYAYVYNYSVEGKKRIYTKFGSNKVWYVSYGSNMLEERFACYVQGGYCKYNGKTYTGCTDKTLPTQLKAVEIPFDMYYSNRNVPSSWNDSAVSFLDVSQSGKAYGKAYLISEEQLLEIHRFEGHSSNWYPDCVQLENLDGIPAYTYAGYKVKNKEPYSFVGEAYRTVLRDGLKESYPNLSNEDIEAYLMKCGNDR